MRWLLALLLCLLPVTALAQACMPHDDALALLKDKYKETPVSSGVTTGGGLVEVTATDGGETWTIIITSPLGISCPVAAGEGWRNMKPTLIGPRA